MLTNILEIRFHLNGTDITSKETPNNIMKKRLKVEIFIALGSIIKIIEQLRFGLPFGRNYFITKMIRYIMNI